MRQRKNSTHSLKSNITNKTVFSYFGVPPISNSILTNTLDFINRYISANFLNDPHLKFPDSFIEKNGAPLFEILGYLTNKNINFGYRVSEEVRGVGKAVKVYGQYNELLGLLKL